MGWESQHAPPSIKTAIHLGHFASLSLSLQKDRWIVHDIILIVGTAMSESCIEIYPRGNSNARSRRLPSSSTLKMCGKVVRDTNEKWPCLGRPTRPVHLKPRARQNLNTKKIRKNGKSSKRTDEDVITRIPTKRSVSHGQADVRLGAFYL